MQEIGTAVAENDVETGRMQLEVSCIDVFVKKYTKSVSLAIPNFYLHRDRLQDLLPKSCCSHFEPK